MGKGKKKETPYSLFVKEFSKKMGCSPAEAYSLAGPQWEKMDDQARNKYIVQANQLRPANPVLSETARTRKEADDWKHAMKEDITSTINFAHDRVFDLNFFVLHMNHFFYHHSEARHYPAEVGFARFNLKNGLQTTPETTSRGETEIKPLVYHTFCNPGKMPTGYAADVKICEHKLPYPGYDDQHQMETSTEKEIFDAIVSYLRQGLRDNQALPPIYTITKDKPVINNIVKWWLKTFGYDENYLKIYDLEELFYQLNVASSRIRDENNLKDGRTVAASQTINGTTHADLLISKDYFDFTPGIACDFHELSDVINQCSKSYVIRWIYLICNYCCDGEDMIPIQHMPKNARVKLNSEAGEGGSCS